jgi:hypothetical protein
MAKKDATIATVMKKDIHPEYFSNAKVTCAPKQSKARYGTPLV